MGGRSSRDPPLGPAQREELGVELHVPRVLPLLAAQRLVVEDGAARRLLGDALISSQRPPSNLDPDSATAASAASLVSNVA